jgi:hypothetical protein
MPEGKKFKRTGGEITQSSIKAGLSLIPGGGVVSELMNLLWQPAITKRKEEWVRELAENLQLLEERVENFQIDKLVEDEAFITASLQATQVAIRTHQQEKLEAIRNTVLNSALNTDLNDELQLLFLSTIDRITPTHILILKSLVKLDQGLSTATANSEAFRMPYTIAISVYAQLNEIYRHVLFAKLFRPKPDADRNEIEQIKAQLSFLTVIIDDLDNQGLITTVQTGSNLSRSYNTEITYFGNQFLEFISTPDALSEQGETS